MEVTLLHHNCFGIAPSPFDLALGMAVVGGAGQLAARWHRWAGALAAALLLLQGHAALVGTLQPYGWELSTWLLQPMVAFWSAIASIAMGVYLPRFESRTTRFVGAWMFGVLVLFALVPSPAAP